LGVAVAYAYVVIIHAGECALVFGIRIVDAPIDIVKSKAMEIAKALDLRFCIFLFSLKLMRNRQLNLLIRVTENI